MSKLIVKTKAYPKEVNVVDIPAGNTAERLAASYGITNANLYEEVADNAFTEEEFSFRDAFDVSNGVATFSLADAKSMATLLATTAYSISIDSVSGSFSTATLLSQHTLPVSARDLDVQTIFDNINAEVTALTAAQQNITAAADITALKVITDSLPNTTVNTFPTNYLASGVLFTGRGSGLGPEDLNVSYYTEFFSPTFDETDTELYVPSVNTVIAYGSGGAGQFDSMGDVFNVGGPFVIQIRQTSTSAVIAQFEVPLNAAGEDVAFNIPA